MQSILDFKIKKDRQQKISMTTCYDYTSACIIDQTHIDCVLVGDSGSMVMLGKKDTTAATLEDMQSMTHAVANGITKKLIIADLPFLSYRQSLAITMQATASLIRAGAHAVKLEGATGNLETIQYIVESGIPVIGHLGLTPQMMHALGGFKVQGKTTQAAEAIHMQAKQLQQAGCFALVLECIPSDLAEIITQALSIPTIGIGAGAQTDGQVLVLQDLLGLNQNFKPKFVKRYLDGATLITNAINTFVDDIQHSLFPNSEHSYRGNLK